MVLLAQEGKYMLLLFYYWRESKGKHVSVHIQKKKLPFQNEMEPFLFSFLLCQKNVKWALGLWLCLQSKSVSHRPNATASRATHVVHRVKDNAVEMGLWKIHELTLQTFSSGSACCWGVPRWEFLIWMKRAFMVVLLRNIITTFYILFCSHY